MFNRPKRVILTFERIIEKIYPNEINTLKINKIVLSFNKGNITTGINDDILTINELFNDFSQ